VLGIQQKTAQLIADLPKGPDKKILVVSVPKDYLGAHVLMGGVNMLELLEPPFTAEHISQYMVGFQRALVGPGEPVNTNRLKMELSSLKDRKAYFWEPTLNDFKVVHYDDPLPECPESIDLPVATSFAEPDKAGVWHPDPAKKAEFKIIDGAPAIGFDRLNDQGGDGLVITGLDINPLAFDFLNLVISMPKAQVASGVYVSFDDNDDAKAPFIAQPQVSQLLEVTKVPTGAPLDKTKVNIKLSHFGDWFSYKKIKRLKISFSNIRAIAVSRISITDDRRMVPQLFVMGREPKASGEYFCDGEPVKFDVNAGLVQGAKTCLVEISKVNQSWETFLTEEVNGRDTVVQVSYNVPLVGGRAGFTLDPRIYAENGFYDVRVMLVNDKNEVASDWSDLIILYQPNANGVRAPFCADY
jgi:hypothetical protein